MLRPGRERGYIKLDMPLNLVGFVAFLSALPETSHLSSQTLFSRASLLLPASAALVVVNLVFD